MNINRLKKLLVFFIVLWSTLSVALAQKPDWVIKHPVSKLYFIGIAVEPKTTGTDHIQTAKNAALNNLASQITVEITGTLDQTVIESAGMVEDEFKRHIKTSTRAELEGFELVDTWEDNDSYWIYYRLSKALYAENKQKKLATATDLSLDLFSKAKKSEKSFDITTALKFYLQSLNPIASYLDKPLEVAYEGSKVYLFNEIISSIQKLFSQIELKPVDASRSAKVGKPLDSPLAIEAIYTGSSSGSSDIYNLPLSFSFIRGSGDLVEEVTTDNNGKASCRVSKIKSPDKIQMVRAELDIGSLISLDDSPDIIKTMLKSFKFPEAKFVLNVSGLAVYLTAVEIHLGKKLDVPAVEPSLKSSLSAFGFIFIDDISGADLAIEIEARSRKGMEIMGGMYSSYVDLTISAIDMATGEEVYKNSLQNIKGIDLDFDKASRKAFTNAGKKAGEEIVPDLIATIQR